MLSPKQSNFFPIDFIAAFNKTLAQHVKWFAFYASVYLDVSGKMIQILLGQICSIIIHSILYCYILMLPNGVLF